MLLLLCACATAAETPLFFFTSGGGAETRAAELSGDLREDAVACASALLAGRSATLVADAGALEDRLPAFLRAAFLARLLADRVSAPGGGGDVELTVRLEDADEARAAELAPAFADRLRLARLHVPVPFSGGLFGDLGMDVPLLDAFSSVTLAGRSGGGGGGGGEEEKPVFFTFQLPDPAVEAEAARVNFDFPPLAAAGLARLAVDEAEAAYASLVGSRPDAGAAELFSAHVNATSAARSVLATRLAGSVGLLAAASEELASLLRDRLSGALLERRLAQNRACDEASRTAGDAFARELAGVATAGAPFGEEVLALAREAVLGHARATSAAGSPADGCPLQGGTFAIQVYARAADFLGSGAVGLREAMLDVSAALLRRYKEDLERAADPSARLSHEELRAVHAQLAAGCSAAFDDHFGRYGPRPDVWRRRGALLEGVAEVWRHVDGRNNESVAEECARLARDVGRRYAGFVEILSEQLEGADADAIRAAMRAEAEQLYDARTAKHAASSPACDGARGEIARAMSRPKEKRKDDGQGEAIWRGLSRLLEALRENGGEVLRGIVALLRKNALGVVVGIAMILPMWCLCGGRGRTGRREDE